MKRNIILSAALAVVLACGCSKITKSDSLDGQISFNMIYPSVATKVSGNSFSEDDVISLYASEWINDKLQPLMLGGNYFNNEHLSFDGFNWTGERPLWWSENPCDFYAFYPAFSDVSSIDNHQFHIMLDQDIPGNYEASDLLAAHATHVSREDGNVSLAFSHMMSKCIVKLVKGSKFEGELDENTVVHIYNTVTSAAVDIPSCTLQKDPLGSHQIINMKKVSADTFEAIVVPQNVEIRTGLVEITMGGIAYLLESQMSFRPGCCHTINVTLNTSPEQEQIEISIDPGVGPWNN